MVVYRPLNLKICEYLLEKFNICIVRPDNYIHSYAFLELGELIYYSLQELGAEVIIGFNNIEPAYKNIILGSHLLSTEAMPKIPDSTVILNTEQIYTDSKSWNDTIIVWAKNFEVWDYSIKNIEKFNTLGIVGAKHFKIGFQKELARLDQSSNKDIDILFYGSINERRRKILDQLENCGLKVKTLFGVYGKERDDWIKRSKLVLNHHFYETEIFEIVRVFYLLTNAVTVVGEVNASTSIEPMYLKAIRGAKYDDLVSVCLEIVKDPSLQERVRQTAFNSISKYPQKIFTHAVINS